MILQKLEVSVISWGDDKGKYKGAAKFGDDRGEVSLNLSAEHIEQIFRVCADGILDTAKRAAADMTVNIIEQIGPEISHDETDKTGSSLIGSMKKLLGAKTP